MILKPGTYLIGRYEILARIGAGGMADVYKALDHRLNRNVAIKVLKEEFSKDQNFVRKFGAEAQAAAGLTHANIVSVYDVSEENGLYFIVMELVEGITLKDFIQAKGKLSVRETVGISIQIAQGLEVAHQNRIVHRDIKPQNIILSKDGLAKVTDFGIAKAVTSNTITSNAVGSVHYISPEQARGGYSDEKSDIYSLGVTMYEMLCGHVPFTGDSTVNVALQHIQQEAEPLHEIDPTIPDSIEKIVQKCMQKKPERRYANVAELIADLKRAVRTPNGDFVKPGGPSEDGSTVVITEAELNDIKTASGATTAEAADIALKDRKKKTTDDDRDRRRKKSDDEDVKALDPEDDEVDPKVEKLMIGGGIAAVVILVLIILFLLSRTIGLFNGSGKKIDESTTESTTVETTTEESTTEEITTEEEIVVPSNILGVDYAVAKITLENMGLVVEQTEDEYSDTYEQGQVMKSDPAAGEVLHPGDLVRLTVSAGPEEITLRTLAGLSEEDATRYLTENNLLAVINREESDSVDSGKVISSSPKGGSSVKPGDTVTITVSSGKGKTIVPDLKDMTESEAEAELKNHSLSKGTVEKEYSDTVEAGRVISQGTAKNTSVEKGSKVDFVISLGRKEYSAEVSVSGSFNPFEGGEDGEEGSFDFILVQDGIEKAVHSATLTHDDFPYSFPITSNSNSDAYIYVMFNNEAMPGEIRITWH
ncbi:MAG: Stk1 family PASTA domain-containing Ser/Thr kinase [Lachnospiraceae bacterium]|nr:Stk1 family PASTA domain-containing Ser/Thr kinase [Lachnospiraceae bacterium]